MSANEPPGGPGRPKPRRIHRARAPPIDEFTDRFPRKATRLTQGDPREEATDIGFRGIRPRATLNRTTGPEPDPQPTKEWTTWI
ncbi:hypothetical protein [Streptomyces violaceusniger]|uniref:hypothetical protein n=1 Tax=Streptomyces violaceusniger TaxID=68280 RepID=UPI0010F47DAF